VQAHMVARACAWKQYTCHNTDMSSLRSTPAAFQPAPAAPQTDHVHAPKSSKKRLSEGEKDKGKRDTWRWSILDQQLSPEKQQGEEVSPKITKSQCPNTCILGHLFFQNKKKHCTRTPIFANERMQASVLL
jgi:hypothetical protein